MTSEGRSLRRCCSLLARKQWHRMKIFGNFKLLFLWICSFASCDCWLRSPSRLPVASASQEPTGRTSGAPFFLPSPFSVFSLSSHPCCVPTMLRWPLGL